MPGKALRYIAARFGFEYQDGKLKNLNRQVGASARRMRIAKKEARKFRKELRSLAFGARALVTGYIGYRAVRALTAFADHADDVAKKSEAAGISARQWQRLDYAAQRAGADVQIMGKSLQRLSRVMNDADRGSQKSIEAFQRLNVEFKKGKKLRSVYDVFMDLSGAFSKLDDKARKTALAQDLMGRSGAELMVLMNTGPEAIQKMGDRVERLGYVMGRDAAAKGEKFKDSMLDLKMILVGLRNRIALSILPTITRAAERFSLWWRESDNARRAINMLKNAAKQAAIVLGMMVTAKIVKMMRALHSAALAAARAIIAFGRAGWIANAKLVAIGVVIAALVVAIQDLIVFAKGGESEIGDFLGGGAYSNRLREDLLQIGAALNLLWQNALKPLAKKILPAVLRLFLFIVRIVSVLVLAILGFVHAVEDGVKWISKIAKKTWEIITETWDKVTGYISKGIGIIKSAILGLVSIVTAPFKAIIDEYNRIAKAFGVGDEIGDPLDKIASQANKLHARMTYGTQTAPRQIGITNPSVNLTVNSAPTEDPNVLQNKIRESVSKGLSDLVSQSYSNLEPAEVAG